MTIIRDAQNSIIGVRDWVNGFIPLKKRELTLEEEVARYGWLPVYNRLINQGRRELAEEIKENYQ